WAEAGCRALGFRAGEFLDAYVKNQARAMELVFNNDPLAQAINLFMGLHGDRWAGNTKPLLSTLREVVREAGETDWLRHDKWPTNAVWLGRELRNSAAVLRKVCQIDIQFDVDLRRSGEGDKDGLVIKKRSKPIEVAQPVPMAKVVRKKVVSWR